MNFTTFLPINVFVLKLEADIECQMMANDALKLVLRRTFETKCQYG